ncbi:ester cyclase [Haladaptatus sp. CMAA 1911]|uniref:ester cyclase n=1 Tax=unclassified Haladaptatus TaxID=2622732 RepID=UPI0037543B9B
MTSEATKLEENKRLARSIPERVFADGDLDLLDELYGEDAIEHNPFGDLRGRAAIRESYEGFIAAFPDIEQKVEDVVAEGDTVAMRLTARGTHEGPMMDLEPTGREVEVQQTVFTRIEDGEIVERWLHPDNLGMLQQLGVVDSELA